MNELISEKSILIWRKNLNSFILTLEGELCEESSVGEEEPVAEPCPTSEDPSLLDLESAIFENLK